MKNKIIKIIRIIATITLVVSLLILAAYIIGDIRDARAAAHIEELRNQEAKAPEVLDEYAALYKENPDTIGWLTVDGTEIDNVVMYAPDEIEKYIHTDFNGEYSFRGCLFIDEYCDIFNSDNLIIYGHNMKDGTMFGTLLYYADEDFYKQHKTIKFDTIYEKHTYEIVAAIKTRIPYDSEDCFRYYEYTGSNDEKMFDEYSKFIEENRLYETGVKLEKGDKIITLSTCAYHTYNGRFIVVARQIS